MGKIWGKGGVSMLSEHHSPQISKCSPTGKLSEPCLVGFYVGFLHRHVNYWHGKLNPISNPSPLRGGESSHPLIMWLTPLATSPHPNVFSRSHSINITEDTLNDLLRGNPKGFLTSVPGKGQRSKYIFIINHSTHVLFAPEICSLEN